MNKDAESQEGEIILYATPEGSIRIEVIYDSETFWLNQKKLADLFGVDVRTISEHLANIFATGNSSWRQRSGNSGGFNARVSAT